MSKVGDLTNYKRSKKAKEICKELLEVIAVVNDCQKKLEPYSKYLPVREIIATNMANQIIMQIHFNKLKRLVND